VDVDKTRTDVGGTGGMACRVCCVGAVLALSECLARFWCLWVDNLDWDATATAPNARATGVYLLESGHGARSKIDIST
jgi:hypothetical protein